MPSTWPAEALRAQAIAARSYAARKLRPGRLLLRHGRRHRVAGLPRLEGRAARRRTPPSTATAGQVLWKGTSIANTMFHSTGGGAHRAQRERVHVGDRQEGRGKVSYLRGSMDRRADGTAYDERRAVRDVAHEDLHARAAVGLVRGGPAHRTSATLTALDLRARGVSGRLIKVTLIGSKGTKTVSARRLPLDPQRRPAGRRPDAAQHAVRHEAGAVGRIVPIRWRATSGPAAGGRAPADRAPIR